MREYIVKKSDEGQTVIKYLNRMLSAAPVSFFYKMIRKKNIVLNDNKKLSGKEIVKEGDVIRLYVSDDTVSMFSDEQSARVDEYIECYRRLGDIKIVYEDEHIIIADKPRGILSQKASNMDVSINEWLIGYMLINNEISNEDLKVFKPSVCNRLDRNTGGIIIFAKTLFGANKINPLIKERTIRKFYHTVCYGNFEKEVHDISFLKKDENANMVEVSDTFIEGYKRIETIIRPVRYNKKKDITLLEVELITGKSHQIRATLNKLGYPIIGDTKYTKINANLDVNGQLLYATSVVLPQMDEYPMLSNREFKIDFPQYITQIMNED